MAAALRPWLSVFMQLGLLFTPVVPDSSTAKTSGSGCNAVRRSFTSTSIAVREMKNKDLILPSSLSKQLDYGFVFFQFETPSLQSASYIMETAARASFKKARLEPPQQ